MKLELRGVSKSFGAQRAVDGVELTLDPVGSLVLIGGSGSGKSTLLRMVAGLEVPDGGSICLDGAEVQFDHHSILAHRRSIGTVFQAFNLFLHLSALDNIMLPLEKVHGWTRGDARDRAQEVLERFRLADHGGKRPAALSGGERQRVAIARAVAIRPRLLLFDEPTSALDPEMTGEVLDLIGELRDEGMELVLVTHEMGFARQVADHVAFLSEGKLVETGTADHIFGDTSGEKTRAFLSKVLKY